MIFINYIHKFYGPPHVLWLLAAFSQLTSLAVNWRAWGVWGWGMYFQGYLHVELLWLFLPKTTAFTRWSTFIRYSPSELWYLSLPYPLSGLGWSHFLMLLASLLLPPNSTYTFIILNSAPTAHLKYGICFLWDTDKCVSLLVWIARFYEIRGKTKNKTILEDVRETSWMTQYLKDYLQLMRVNNVEKKKAGRERFRRRSTICKGSQARR